MSFYSESNCQKHRKSLFNKDLTKIIQLLRKENTNINNSFLDYSLSIDEMNSYIDNKVEDI